MKSQRAILAVLLLTTFGIGASAQDSTQVHRKWHYLTEAYLMFPNMKGETTVGNLPELTVDLDEADIFGNLTMGAMVYFEATNDDWTVATDFIYMRLEQGVDSSKLISSGQVKMEEVAWQLDGLKRVSPGLDIGLGGRLVSLGVDIGLTGAGPLAQESSGAATKTWYDPVFVLRAQHTLKEKWLLGFRGDIGGVGIGSDLTWQLQGNVGYRFSKLFQAKLGYRYIAIDYDKGEGQDRFLYDIDTYGWELRLGFNF